MNEAIQRLEEKMAYLERHVVEQDKAMLDLADELAQLRRELAVLRGRNPDLRLRPGDEDDVADERPPHY